jgi:hypothetical protein
MFNWATFRQTKGAVKLHLRLDHDGYLPVYAHLAERKRLDGRSSLDEVTKQLEVPTGQMLDRDKTYRHGILELMNVDLPDYFRPEQQPALR